jgi:hypothetical protein
MMNVSIERFAFITGLEIMVYRNVPVYDTKTFCCAKRAGFAVVIW